MLLQKRAVEVAVCKISLLIEHLKVYLKVAEVEGEAEAGDGAAVEEEGVTGKLSEWCCKKKATKFEDMYQKNAHPVKCALGT